MKLIKFDSITKKYHDWDYVREYFSDKQPELDGYYRNFEEGMRQGFLDNGLTEDDLKNGRVGFNDFSFMPSLFRDGDSILNTIDAKNYLGKLMNSKWVYIEEKDSGKYLLNGLSLRRSNDELMGISLFEGWNIKYVFPSLVYGENYVIDSKSLSEYRGDCEIERVYFFDSENQGWVFLGLNYNFNEDDIYKGIAIEVKEDCRLSNSFGGRVEVPQLPN